VTARHTREKMKIAWGVGASPYEKKPSTKMKEKREKEEGRTVGIDFGK